MINVTDGPVETLVRVDGRLAGDGVAELERVLESTTSPARLLVHHLRGADDPGLAVLRRLAEQGTPLDGLSPYIQLTLAGAASSESIDLRSPAHSETPLRSTET
jgi:hypothetical protein